MVVLIKHYILVDKERVCACNYTNGQITDLRVWKTVLTQSQIKEWMYKEADELLSSSKNLNRLFGGKLENESNSGSTVTDSGPNSLNGTISGAVWHIPMCYIIHLKLIQHQTK